MKRSKLLQNFIQNHTNCANSNSIENKNLKHDRNSKMQNLHTMKTVECNTGKESL